MPTSYQAYIFCFSIFFRMIRYGKTIAITNLDKSRISKNLPMLKRYTSNPVYVRYADIYKDI